MKEIVCRWRKYLTGEGTLPHWIKRLDQESMTLLEGLNLEGDDLWSELPLPIMQGTQMDSRRISRNLHLTGSNLLVLAQALRTKGSKLYGNKEVESAVIGGLKRINQRIYSADENCPFFGNWWHFEIGIPIALLSTVLLLHDEMEPQLVTGLTEAAKRYTYYCDRPSGYEGSPEMTAANLVDKAVVVTLWGVLSEKEEALIHVKESIQRVLCYTDKGDGFYQDGSFIQHEALSYIGAYGKDLYEKFSLLSYVLKDSLFQLQYENKEEKLLFHFIFSGIEPFLWQGKIMDMVSGRGVTRAGQDDKVRGRQMLVALLPYYESLSQKEEKIRLGSLLKYHLQFHKDDFFQYVNVPLAAEIARKLMEDKNIPQYKLPHKCYFFPGMDKLVWRNEQIAVALSMHSNRTYGHELINEEGKQTWHLSDGMLYLYGQNRDSYGGDFWAAVDATRLPGTTAEHVIHPSGAGDREYNVFADVGGVSFESYGVAGQHLKVLGLGNQRNGAEARKSWFFFGEEILAMGCGISSHTGQPVETIIENRKIIKKKQKLITDEKNKGLNTEGHKWVYFKEEEEKGTAYIALNPETMELLHEVRESNWLKQGDFEKPAVETFETMWISHGCNPVEQTYAYLILNNVTEEQVLEKQTKSGIEILYNTPSLQVAEKKEEGITLLLFWEKPDYPVCGVKPNHQAAVLLKKTEGMITVAAADLGRSLSELEIEINGCKKLLSFKNKGETAVCVFPWKE
ncbi:polysaccharide lyase 8 family protein [Lachnospiraceae bacterium OttesenSCG-928-D06]|nr:polysaccharide lyase 8 family protein [Lachnospiraceae bacterium OttesenSCG-928-D06]